MAAELPSGAPPTGDVPVQKAPAGKKSYQKIEMPTAEQIMGEDFMNNCAIRTGMSGVMGSVLGVFFGVFMGTMDTSMVDGTLAGEQKQTVRQVIKEMAQKTGARSLSYAKGFGAMGALFAGSECVVEKFRAKHDVYNSVYAGCSTGAILAYSAGPKAMCIGCASFAAFSALIDRFISH